MCGGVRVRLKLQHVLVLEQPQEQLHLYRVWKTFLRTADVSCLRRLVSRCPLIPKSRFRLQVSSCGICDGRNGAMIGFLDISAFPCQRYSVNAARSFIYPPPTLYNISSWQRRWTAHWQRSQGTRERKAGYDFLVVKFCWTKCSSEVWWRSLDRCVTRLGTNMSTPFINNAR